MHMLFAIAALLSFNTNAQPAKTFKERFYLLGNKCHSVIVEMNSGTLKDTPGDDFSILCDPVKNKTALNCMVLHKDGKKTDVVYDGGIMGSDGIINLNNVESFNINMVTKRFQSDSYVFIDNGRIRGMKICAGDFMYDSDYKRLTEKSKRKK